MAFYFPTDRSTNCPYLYDFEAWDNEFNRVLNQDPNRTTFFPTGFNPEFIYGPQSDRPLPLSGINSFRRRLNNWPYTHPRRYEFNLSPQNAYNQLIDVPGYGVIPWLPEQWYHNGYSHAVLIHPHIAIKCEHFTATTGGVNARSQVQFHTKTDASDIREYQTAVILRYADTDVLIYDDDMSQNHEVIPMFDYAGLKEHVAQVKGIDSASDVFLPNLRVGQQGLVHRMMSKLIQSTVFQISSKTRFKSTKYDPLGVDITFPLVDAHGGDSGTPILTYHHDYGWCSPGCANGASTYTPTIFNGLRNLVDPILSERGLLSWDEGTIIVPSSAYDRFEIDIPLPTLDQEITSEGSFDSLELGLHDLNPNTLNYEAIVTFDDDANTEVKRSVVTYLDSEGLEPPSIVGNPELVASSGIWPAFDGLLKNEIVSLDTTSVIVDDGGLFDRTGVRPQTRISGSYRADSFAPEEPPITLGGLEAEWLDANFIQFSDLFDRPASEGNDAINLEVPGSVTFDISISTVAGSGSISKTFPVRELEVPTFKLQNSLGGNSVPVGANWSITSVDYENGFPEIENLDELIASGLSTDSQFIIVYDPNGGLHSFYTTWSSFKSAVFNSIVFHRNKSWSFTFPASVNPWSKQAITLTIPVV